MKLLLVAACALIDADNRVLIAQRPPAKSMPGLWEFPGGKLEPGETPEDCVLRELREELGVTTWRNCLAPLTFASHTYAEFHLLMPLFVCRKWEGPAIAQEHTAIKWVPARGLREYEMPPADVPLVAALIDLL